LVAEMQQIVDWLKKLGMSENAESAENDIDIAVLPDLTDQHLKESLSARCPSHVWPVRVCDIGLYLC
jgi:hypothetical protein